MKKTTQQKPGEAYAEVLGDIRALPEHLAVPGTTTVTDAPSELPSFSWFWVWTTVMAFVVCNTMLRGLFSNMSMHGQLLAEALINIATYYLGGLVVGFLAPRSRTMEIASAGIISTLLVLTVGMLLPLPFLQASLGKIAFLGILAALLAMTGADHGRRLKGKR